MHDAIPSRTAFRVALRRAAHQLFDDPLVLADPLATRIVGEEAMRRLLDERGRELHPLARHMRAFMAARSRRAEDQLRSAVAADVRQYVVLGAGLDTFAYRSPHAGLRVFEVDHPATQGWKRQLLADAQIAVPESLTFAPVDFERQGAGEALRSVGFREEEPAFISWLGVAPYLSEEAFAGTLAWIGAMPPGSAVVFDYATDPHTLGFMERLAFKALAARVARAGEPFRLFRRPDVLAGELREWGFSAIDDWDAARINEHYFANRADGLRIGGSMAHIMTAGR